MRRENLSKKLILIILTIVLLMGDFAAGSYLSSHFIANNQKSTSSQSILTPQVLTDVISGEENIYSSHLEYFKSIEPGIIKCLPFKTCVIRPVFLLIYILLVITFAQELCSRYIILFIHNKDGQKG